LTSKELETVRSCTGKRREHQPAS